MSLPRREILRRGLAYGLGGIVGSVLDGGCSSEFFKTDFIRDNVNNLLKSKEELEERYKAESRVLLLDHPERKKESYFSISEDGKIMLYYNNEFASTSDLEKIVTKMIEGSKVTPTPNNNMLVIEVKNKNELGKLQELLANADQYPPQALIKFRASTDFGDKAHDYAMELNMSLRGQGKQFGAITDNTLLPGAVDRVKARASMGAIWGGQIETGVFDLEAVLDTLESYGSVKHIFQTYLLLSNGKKGMLGGEENLPIPEKILAGITPVQTYKLEAIKSSFEGTANILNGGLVYLQFTAGISSAKRTDLHKVDFQTPVRDTVSNEGIYLPVGYPLIFAGKLIDMEIGINRRDAIMPWLASSKDYERQLARTYYEITLYRVVYWDNSSLKSQPFKYKPLEQIIIPEEKN